MKRYELFHPVRLLMAAALFTLPGATPGAAQSKQAAPKGAPAVQKKAGSGAGKAEPASQARVLDCGAIEIGFTGVKGGLYTFTQTPEGIDVKQHVYPKDNPIAGFKDGAFTEDGIKDLATATSDILRELRKKADELHLLPRYFVVASSSVAAAKNLGQLRDAVKAKSGIDMDTIEASQEAELAWISSVPRNRFGQVLLFDIGGGNTKIGYLLTAVNGFRSVEVKWGSRNLSEAVPAEGDYQQNVQAIIDSKVMPVYDAAIEKNAALAGLDRIYLIGGSAWALGVVMHPEQALERRWVRLKPTDIDGFLARVKDGTWNMDPKDNPAMAGKSAATLEQARKDIDELKSNNAMTAKRMIAGASLTKAYLSRSSKQLTMFFPRHGQGLYGYVLTKFAEGESNSGSHNIARKIK